MKTHRYFLAILAFCVLQMQAQIPNAGFENWTATGSYEQPDGWATMNFICAGPFYSTTKSTDHFPANVGSYSVRIENNTALTQTTGGWGIIATNGFTWPAQPAFPIIGHPQEMCGFYKFQSQNGDTGVLSLILFYQGNEVGNTTQIYLPDKGNNWEDFCEEIEYGSYSGPVDSGFLMVFAYRPHGQTDPPKGNSVLYLDNLNFDESIGMDENGAETRFTYYPIPAENTLNLSIVDLKEKARFTIYSIIGTPVKVIELTSSTLQIDVSSIGQGVYIAELNYNGKIYRDRIIISR